MWVRGKSAHHVVLSREPPGHAYCRAPVLQPGVGSGGGSGAIFTNLRAGACTVSRSLCRGWAGYSSPSLPLGMPLSACPPERPMDVGISWRHWAPA